MKNPFSLLAAVTPRMVIDGVAHRWRTAAREVRATKPEAAGLAFGAGVLRALRRTRPAAPPSTPVGAVLGVVVDGAEVRLTCAQGEVRISALAGDLLQLRVGEGPQHSYAVVDQPSPPVRVDIVESGVDVVVRTPAVEVRVERATGAMHVGAMKLRLATNGWSATFDAATAFHGLGEKASALNHAGRRFELWNSDPASYSRGNDPLYLGIPFLVAQRGGAATGLFFDNPHRSWFDVGATTPGVVDVRAAGGQTRLYVMSGSPAVVLERYTALTGRHRLPPVWALGFHQSRYSYFPQARVLEVARQFRERRLPCDVLHLDIHYMDAYRCFTWDAKRFPAPRELLTALHDQGFKALSMIDPGIKVDPGYPVYDEGLARRAFISWPDGSPFTGPVWPGDCHFPDFSSASVREWWGGLYRGLLDDGVDAFWNDMNEIALISIPLGAEVPGVVRHDADGRGASHDEVHNQYGMLMARASVEGLARLRPSRRPVLLTRSGWAGVQRYALHWTGDNESTWDHLRLSIQMVLNLGLSGVAFTGPDTGGFTGEPTPELFARWMQVSAFMPFFRVHSIIGSSDQEPWAFGPDVEAICRKYLELRYRLLPYLYTAAWQTTRTGAPMLRAMSFAFPDDARFASTDDQYLVGDALLVAPILDEGRSQRTVLLPKGDWYDFWSLERHVGGATVDVTAPLAVLPIFVRAGAVVPLWPVQQFVGEKTIDSLELRVFAGDGESVLYEDDGLTPGAPYRESRFAVQRERFSLSRRFVSGDGPAVRRLSARIVGLPRSSALTPEPSLVLEGGAVVSQTWDGACLDVTLDVPGEFRLASA